jgi:lipooligosaccharide transport system permease protein
MSPATWGAVRLVERSAMVYRRTWIIMLSGFVEPVLYLMSIRLGLGRLVGDVDLGGGRVVTYAAFVAPGLMAAAAMNGAVYDSTFNIYFKLRHAKTYDAVLATPLRAADVALGEIAWAMLRGLLYAVAFAVTLTALGLAESWWLLAAIPASLLVSLTFATLGMAATTYMRAWSDFEWVGAVTMPIFLFSATFFPTSSYGSAAWLVNLSPLYHGVELMRAAATGRWDATLPLHAAVLAIVSALAARVVVRRFHNLLVT